MQAAVGISGLLSLVLCLVCSSAAWAGHRNQSSSVTPGSAARAQGTLLQAAALSVAVGPGQQLGGKQQISQLPRRCRVRLPSWYRRAQAAQLQGRCRELASVRPADRPQLRARVREPGRVLAESGGSRRKPARQQRVKSTASARAASVRGRASLRFDSDARGARHRRLVQDALEQEADSQARQSRAAAGEAAIERLFCSQKDLHQTLCEDPEALMSRSGCSFSPAPCACGWSIDAGNCRCCHNSLLRDSCDGCEQQSCSSGRYLSNPIRSCVKMLPRLSDVYEPDDESRESDSLCGSDSLSGSDFFACSSIASSRPYKSMFIDDSSCGRFCDRNRVVKPPGYGDTLPEDFLFEFQEIMAKGRFEAGYSRCGDIKYSANNQTLIFKRAFDCEKENMQQQWPTWTIANFYRDNNWPKFLYGLCHWCLPLNDCHYPGERRHSLVPVQLSSSGERWLLVTSRRELDNATELRVLSLSRSGERSTREWPQTDPLQPLDHESSLQEARYRHTPDLLADDVTDLRGLMTSAGTLYHVYLHGGRTGQDPQEVHWSTMADVNASLSRSFSAFFHGSSVPGHNNCPACLGGIECPHSTTRPKLNDPSYRAGRGWLPPGEPGRLLLLSEEEDGVNLWIRNNGSYKGTVERWSLGTLLQCDNAQPTRRFVLDSLNGDSGPIALARHENWLYSLHNSSAGQVWQLRRWSLTDAQEDTDWQEQVNVLPDLADPHLMPDPRSCRLYVMETGTLPYEGVGCPVSLEPVLPDVSKSDIGMYRKWRAHPLAFVTLPSAGCLGIRSCLPPGSASTGRTSPVQDLGGLAGLVALVPAAGAALAAGGCLYKWGHKRQKGRDDLALRAATVQAMDQEFRDEDTAFDRPDLREVSAPDTGPDASFVRDTVGRRAEPDLLCAEPDPGSEAEQNGIPPPLLLPSLVVELAVPGDEFDGSGASAVPDRGDDGIRSSAGDMTKLLHVNAEMSGTGSSGRLSGDH